MPVVPIPPKSSVTPPLLGGDNAADAYARAAKDRAETTVALDATNQLQGLRSDLSNPDTGYRSLLGGDAVKGIDGQALTGHYLSLFDQGWKDISSKLMPGPQGMFDAAALNMRDDFAKDLVKHEVEQGRVWRQQVLNTTVGNATSALIAGTDGRDDDYTAKARGALLADGLGQGLSGEDLDKQTNFLFGRRVVEPVVTARLGRGDVVGAKAFFDVHRDGMAGDDADILDQRLTEAQRFADTRIAVDGVWNRLGPKSFNDPIDLDGIEDGLVAYHGGDEEARMRAHDEVLHRIFGFTQARDETHAGYVNFLMGQVKDGASPAQIATLPQFLALPKDKQQQLSDWHREQRADRLTWFEPDQNLDRMARQFAAYHDLAGDDALKPMSVPQVQALEPMLGEDLAKQALAKKQAAPALDNSSFALVARTEGINPTPGPLDVMTKARLGALRSRVEAAVAAAEAASGPLSPEQRLKIALDAGATTVNGHPLFESPQLDAVLNVKPDAMKMPEPALRLAKPHAHGGSHPGNAGYLPPAFWPGQPEQDHRINFDLGSYRKSILDKLYRPAPGNAGPWKKVTVGGKSYFEMSDSGGNHISTTAFEPVDEEARAQWEKGQERLQDLIDSPSGAIAYGAAYLAGASQEDQDRALEWGKAAGQIVGAVTGIAGGIRRYTPPLLRSSKPINGIGENAEGQEGDAGNFQFSQVKRPDSGYVSKARRLEYMGTTPHKYSRTGAAVVKRMQSEGLIVGEGPLLRGNPNNLQLLDKNGQLIKIDHTIDMNRPGFAGGSLV